MGYVTDVVDDLLAVSFLGYGMRSPAQSRQNTSSLVSRAARRVDRQVEWGTVNSSYRAEKPRRRFGPVDWLIVSGEDFDHAGFLRPAQRARQVTHSRPIGVGRVKRVH